MAAYINTGNDAFVSVLNGEYVDKTGLIALINDTLFTEKRFSCVSRPRRFGKSMAAKMLCAYYDRSCSSRHLFRGLEIEAHPDFEKHLNRYPVIYADMTSFTTRFHHDDAMVDNIQQMLIRDIAESYPHVSVLPDDDLLAYLLRVSVATGDKFVFIIDEWDAICRESQPQAGVIEQYVNLLRRLFKGAEATRVFAAVYMTGIFPIKKYKTESALNNFREYSVLRPGALARYMGFTRDEVKQLCLKHNMNYDLMALHYDGYCIGNERAMFNPNSVMEALDTHLCFNYWGTTGAFDAVARYIQMDYEGLKHDIVQMLSGSRCAVNTNRFRNDPHQVLSKDDVLTLLIHMGYLSYDADTHQCYIPNREVRDEMESAVVENDWSEVIDAISAADELLEHLLEGDADEVAEGVARVHEANASVLAYNNENALACVINLAFYTARNHYQVLREMPAGKGFADVVMVPLRHESLPAVVIELKWKQSAQTALDQIRERHYPAPLKDFAGHVVLCGINYDPKTKEHTCAIDFI